MRRSRGLVRSGMPFCAAAYASRWGRKVPFGTPSRLIARQMFPDCLLISISLTGAMLSANDVTCLVVMERISLHAMLSPLGGSTVMPARSMHTSPMATSFPDS